ncbi:ataxin-2 homolog [Durio zibethinus]|uniref:Ataxin-2 homolog n=1 Tax=Durio zibethinus TaxID=66656 RepID=A0A6P5Z639_DURZI|nr:ataxin-2 homolog [Durio zibethinus]
MSNFHQGSAPKDTHRQVHSSSNNNQDEDFSEEDSPLMQMSGENQIQQQQQQQVPQIIKGAPLPLKDSDTKESSRISSHSQQQALVKSPQGCPPKDDSLLNHQRSYPGFQQQQSSTRVSTSQEHSSKGDHLTNTQNTYHPPQQQLLTGATSLQEQPQPCNQSSNPSKQQQSPISAPPPKNNHPGESNQSSHRSHQEPAPVTAPSERHVSEDDNTASPQNSKHLQQQPLDCLQGEPPKQANPMTKPSNTSNTQQDSTNCYDPHKSQSSSIKDPSAQGHAAPLKSEAHESVHQKTVTKQKDEASTGKVATTRVEWSPKNPGVTRTHSKSTSCCPCSIL